MKGCKPSSEKKAEKYRLRALLLRLVQGEAIGTLLVPTHRPHA